MNFIEAIEYCGRTRGRITGLPVVAPVHSDGSRAWHSSSGLTVDAGGEICDAHLDDLGWFVLRTGPRLMASCIARNWEVVQ